MSNSLSSANNTQELLVRNRVCFAFESAVSSGKIAQMQDDGVSREEQIKALAEIKLKCIESND